MAGSEEAAGRLLETSEGGVSPGGGTEGPSSTGRDPWVLTEVGVDVEFFSIFSEIKKM